MNDLSLYRRRRFGNAVAMVFACVAAGFGLLFLGWILWTLVAKGLSAIGGGVDWLNNAQSMPARPLATSVHRIQPRNSRPNAAAAQASTMATAFPRRRRR